MLMKYLAVFYFLAISAVKINAQLLTWTPAFPKDNDNIVITLDASKGNQGLFNYSPTLDIYVHTGLITSNSSSSADWKYSKFTWGTTTAIAQATYIGNNKWQFTINNIRAFYNTPTGVPSAEAIRKIAILFRNGNGNSVQRNADGSDMYIPIYDNSLSLRITDPFFQPTYVPVAESINKQVGDNLSISATTNASANLKILFNGVQIQSTINVTTISANPQITVAGNNEVFIEATSGARTVKDSVKFFVPASNVIAVLPAGVRDGINYHTDNTIATLVLYAPGKNRVTVTGDLPGSNFTEQLQYQLKKTPDGNYWWLTLTGLTPGTEYAFQYVVDGTIRTGDPYAEKILHPNDDAGISSTTFPGLRPYPVGQSGIFSILQTAEPVYTWQNINFNRPNKKSLVIYELLMRDFIAAHDWNTLRDTLNYLRTLGVNAIEVMPLNEFGGNNSWGYNPEYFFAPDKYYGTKNSLKRFVDSCHSLGIAVIMDVALNHATGSCPLAALYWNGSTNAPAANNPWFNETARHPYNVFNDFNHESLATRYFTSRVIEHWLKEYKIDGYRFDLSKGFTQNNSGNNVGFWSSYDASRIAIWKRYYDTMQLKSSGSICILEHFADNTEEIELSDYGMLLWANNTGNYARAIQGFSSADANGNTWNFEGNLFTARNWNQPHLVGYMESHDEERQMYSLMQSGNSTLGYNTRNFLIAPKRLEMAAAFFLNMPGPKMIWQFGEIGYDFSINYCTNGTVNSSCRLDPKPIQWDYLQDVLRKRLSEVYGSLNKLRVHPFYKNNFTSNRVTRDLSGALKWMKLTTDTSNILVVGNFEVTQQAGNIIFQNSGIWYDYLTGATITATGTTQNITLQPGEYHVYLNRNVVNAVTTAIPDLPLINNLLQPKIFPNPAGKNSYIEFTLDKRTNVQIDVYNNTGQKLGTAFNGTLNRGKQIISLSHLKNIAVGGYFATIKTNEGTGFVKFIVIE